MAGKRYYEEAVLKGDTAWDLWINRTEQDRADVAHAIGADPTHLSFLQNASLAMNIVALTVGPDCNILALDKEFPSCTTPFLRAGCDLHFIQTDIDGYVDADMLEAHLHPSHRVFVISSVQFATGFRANLKELGRVCRNHEILFVVDATQSIGAFPINMEDDNIDVLVFSGYKWATAGYGVAVMATTETWPKVDPPLIGWRSATNAYALENNRLEVIQSGIGHEMGHPAFPVIFSMGEAIRSLSQTGIEAIAWQIARLVVQLRRGLEDRGIPIRSNGKHAHSSGIVLADFEGPNKLCKSLRSRGVWTTVREGGLRISVHGYNTEDDILQFFAETDSVGGA